jgi:endonuclease G, mitochondrial
MCQHWRGLIVPYLAAAGLVVGCAGGAVQEGVRVAPRTTLAARQANFSEEDNRRIRRNCPEGRPTLDPEFGFGPTRFVIREGYVLQHSSRDKIPIWVCEGIEPAQLRGALTRSNPFAPDPLLPAGERSELADYRGSGFDRGHMAPAGDQTVDEDRKKETFFLSNMAPQVPRMNQQIWGTLEAKARDWLAARGGGFILTGGLFYDPKEDDATTADGLINFEQIGQDLVAVPTHFFKIVVAKGQGGRWEAIGFVLENRAYERPFDFSQFIRSIDWIEEHAGVDFMPDLDPMEEGRVEGSQPALWTP